MLNKFVGYFFTYLFISLMALLIPIFITPHMELNEGQVEFSISKVLIVASFVSLLGSFSLMNFLPVVFVKKGRNNLNRMVSKILIVYIISSILSLALMSLFFPIVSAIQIIFFSVSTMIYSTVLVYNQCLGKNISILLISLTYYALVLTVYFLMAQHCSIAWSRVLANITAALIILIYHIFKFEYSSFFDKEQWIEILQYSKSIFFHLFFGIALTYLDKLFLLSYYSEVDQINYSYVVLYFMPFASFYNQLFNALKPQLYAGFEKGISITRYFIYNVFCSGFGVLIYGYILYKYLGYLKIVVHWEFFIPIALITWIWCHYLIPASIIIYKNNNKTLSRTSTIVTIFAAMALYVLVRIDMSAVFLLCFYSLIIMSYNLVLKRVSCGI